MSGVARGASSNRGARYVLCYILRDCAIIIRRGRGPKTRGGALHKIAAKIGGAQSKICLLYTSPSPRDGLLSRMPSSA